MATGYSTLYGDSAGGFAVIKDVAKTLVYELCRYRNDRAGSELIPSSGPRQGAVGRAAPGPARRRVAAALLGARPGDGRLRGGRPVQLTTWWPRVSTRTRWPGSWGWWTGPSTSAARCRRGCGSRARPSARIDGCRSPTTTRPSAHRPTPRPPTADEGLRPLSELPIRTIPPSVDGPDSDDYSPMPLDETAAIVGEYRWIETTLYRHVSVPGSVTCRWPGCRSSWMRRACATPGTPSCGVTVYRCGPAADPDALTRPSSATGALFAALDGIEARGRRTRVDLAAGRPGAGTPARGAAPSGRSLPGRAAAAGDLATPVICGWWRRWPTPR